MSSFKDRVKTEMDKLLEDFDLKKLDDRINKEIEDEKTRQITLEKYTFGEDEQLSIEKIAEKKTDGINTDSLEWIETVPSSKKARLNGNYWLCSNKHKNDPVYKQLVAYIVSNRKGYGALLYNGYFYSIIRTGICRRPLV